MGGIGIRRMENYTSVSLGRNLNINCYIYGWFRYWNLRLASLAKEVELNNFTSGTLA